MRLALVELLIRKSIRRDCDGSTVIPVRRVIVCDDLGGRSDRRSGCCQRCCQLVDHVDPRRLPLVRGRSSCRAEGGNARRDSSLPRTSRAEGQGAAVVSISI
jgi:hypothetical protein